MYSIIDVETTGGNAWTDRITEIAVFVHDGKQIVRQFNSLVNPERPIPPFVVKLTGITDEMVGTAPFFHEIARDIEEITEGTIFVGHNVQFDYSFVKQEFKNAGLSFNKKTLCTCKLSRKLIPGHPSYSLGKLCQQLGIELNNRHRATGDAEATVRLFERILHADLDGSIEMALNPVKHAHMPDCLDTERIYEIPERPGIYYFHDRKGEIIYIGKSKNIRKRILSHFKAKKSSSKNARIRSELHEVTYHVTGTELIALLMESEEIKKHLPKYNRSGKIRKFDIGIFDRTDEHGYLQLFAANISKQNSKPLASFRKMEHALHVIHQKVVQHQLCTKLSGIEKGNGPCFNHQVKKCKGACIHLEAPESYNKRVETAISTLHFEHPHFLIIDKGRNHLEQSVVKVENGQYSGYGYFDPSVIGNNLADIREAAGKHTDNPETHHIIHAHLRSEKNIRLVTL